MSAIPDETPNEFFARHCALGPSHVVLAIILESDYLMAVFSTLDKAEAWAESRGPALFTPYIIDAPEFGERNTSH